MNAGRPIEENLNQNMPKHIPVLLHESIDALGLEEGEVFVDATYGGGGHSSEVRRRFPTVEMIAIDRDPEANVTTTNFRDLDKVLEGRLVDAILFDLGISSDQLEELERGFSFQKDEPLDMRMSRKGITAADILNFWDESALELILRGFGEEKFSKKIAQAIVERRKVKPFKTTFDLIGVILEIKPRSWIDKIHPATKTFQALRIATNDELTSLEIGLEKSFEALKPGGRLVVISFHSLEDRIVKNFFRNKAGQDLAGMITKKPIVPSAREVEENPRSRSAKLRVIEKI